MEEGREEEGKSEEMNDKGGHGLKRERKIEVNDEIRISDDKHALVAW